MGQSIIQTRDLTVNFGGHTAVDHVTLDIMPRTFTSIIGPNGAGKTTFFNLVSGLLKPSAGQVFQRAGYHRSARTSPRKKRDRPVLPDYQRFSESDHHRKCQAGGTGQKRCVL